MADKILFKELLRLNLRSMTPAKRAKLKNNQPKYAYPSQHERAYRKAIIELYAPLMKAIKSGVENNIDRWVRTYKSDSVRIDEFADEVKDYISDLQRIQKELFESEQGRGNVLAIALKVGDDIRAFNNAQMKKQLMLAIGTNLFEDEAYAAKAIKAWSDDQVPLITGIGQSAINNVSTIVSEGVKDGRSAAYIKEKIAEMVPRVASRAALIARDQVGKLQSRLSQARQTELGIDMYIWDTAQDERVRGNPAGKYPRAIPSHFLMQGKICRWDDSTVYSEDGKKWLPRTARMPMVHAGIEIQCRCIALPYFNDMVSEVIDEEQRKSVSEEPIILPTVPIPKAQTVAPLEIIPKDKIDVIKDFEKDVVNNNFETALIVDDTGKILLQKRGTKSRVSFTGVESLLMRNNTLTHNHPDDGSGGGSFSKADLITSMLNNMKEIQACDKKYRYRLIRPVEGWKVENISLYYNKQKSYISRVYSDSLKNEVAKYKLKNNSNIIPRDAVESILHSTTADTVRKLNKRLNVNIEYLREVR